MMTRDDVIEVHRVFHGHAEQVGLGELAQPVVPAGHIPPFPDDGPDELVEGQGQEGEISSAHPHQEGAQDKSHQRGDQGPQKDPAQEREAGDMQPARDTDA